MTNISTDLKVKGRCLGDMYNEYGIEIYQTTDRHGGTVIYLATVENIGKEPVTIISRVFDIYVGRGLRGKINGTRVICSI